MYTHLSKIYISKFTCEVIYTLIALFALIFICRAVVKFLTFRNSPCTVASGTCIIHIAAGDIESSRLPSPHSLRYRRRRRLVAAMSGACEGAEPAMGGGRLSLSDARHCCLPGYAGLPRAQLQRRKTVVCSN